MKKVLLFIATALLLSACHRDDPAGSNPKDRTHIQFVSASPSEQHPDLYMLGSSSPFTSDFYYYLATGYTAPYIADLTITTKDYAHGTVLTTPHLPCSKDSNYTWFLYDTFPNLKYYLTTNVSLPSIPTDKAAVKFVNLSPNAGAIRYRIQGQASLTADLGYAGTSPLTCASPYVLMDSGWHQIEVIDAATSQVIDSTGYLFYGRTGHNYTIWTTGFRGATGQDELYTGWTEDH